MILFEFLSGYNFTTDESTSQFQQVAIDPEMLGRIFENLLAEIVEETGEQARKAKGAFYTPREIVDYMCKESLKEY
jgi:type I restriction-modification system DNA methylase subunit